MDVNEAMGAVTGYDPFERFFASKYQQGERVVYSLDWSVPELVTYLPKPDPHAPLTPDSTQRQINMPHASGFKDYVLTEPEWVAPALLLQAPSIFEFKAVEGLDTGTTVFGVLGVPKDARAEIKILDGQHRTLGFHMAWEKLTDDLSRARADLQGAKKSQDPVTTSAAQERYDRLSELKKKLARERVSVQIVEVLTPGDARRIFVDINDNAKGVTGSVKSRFDDRKVINRALNIVLKDNEFLQDRVDLQQDVVRGNSKYLLGAKHVSDILRALQVGAGRIGKRIESELVDAEVAHEFDAFIDALVSAFPALQSFESGDLTARELREESLIGSTVMLRGFAIAWYLLKQAGWSEDDIQKGFSRLEPHMSAPVMPSSEDTWFQTGLFPHTDSGAYAPTSRAQDLRALGEFLFKSVSADNMEWTRVA